MESLNLIAPPLVCVNPARTKCNPGFTRQLSFSSFLKTSTKCSLPFTVSLSGRSVVRSSNARHGSYAEDPFEESGGNVALVKKVDPSDDLLDVSESGGAFFIFASLLLFVTLNNNFLLLHLFC